MYSVQRKQRMFLFVAAVVLLAASCEDRSFFMDDQRGNDPTLVSASIREGDVLLADEKVLVELAEDIEQRSGAVPDLLRIEILGGQGESLGIQEIRGQELNEQLPAIEIDPDLQGLHTLLLTLISDTGSLITEKRINFFTGSRYPSIDLLETYPPEALPPGGKGIIVPRVSGAEEGWLRWSAGGDILASGPYSEFRRGFVWTAPQDTGVYAIRLEVFPVAPPQSLGSRYPFSSPISSEVQFFVSSGAPGLRSELGPAERYRHLLHFGGAINDAGFAPAAFSFSGAAPPVVISQGVYGYRFTPESQLTASTTLLPSAEEGVAPFTLTFRYLPEGNQRESQLVRVEDSAGRPYFRMAFDSQGVPFVQLQGAGSGRLSAGSFRRQETREIACSLVPRGDELEVRWYRNGRHLSTQHYEYRPEPLPEEGSTIIGGPEGFSGVLYEIGLFTRDEQNQPAADEAVFRRFVQERFGKREIFYANGFESESFILENENGERRVYADVLRVPAGQERELFSLDGEWQRLEVELDVEQGLAEGHYLFIRFPDDTAIIRHDGSLRWMSQEKSGDAQMVKLRRKGPSGIAITITGGPGQPALMGQDGTPVRLHGSGKKPAVLGVGVIDGGQGNAPSGDLRIESVLAVRATDKLAEKEKKPKNKIES